MYNIQNIQNLKRIIFRIHLFANAICKKGNLFPFIRAGIRTMGAEDSHCDGTPTPRLVMMAMMMTRRRTTMTMTRSRVAGLGRLSAGAKMAMKPFVKRVFTIFATNSSFVRVISNFRI